MGTILPVAPHSPRPLSPPPPSRYQVAALAAGCESSRRGNKAVGRTPFPPSPPPDATRLPARLSARWVDFPALPLSRSPTTPLPPPVWGVGFLVARPSRPDGEWRAAATAVAPRFLERRAALRHLSSFSLSLLTVFPGNSVVTRSSSSVSLSHSLRLTLWTKSPLQRAIRPNQPSCRRCG